MKNSKKNTTQPEDPIYGYYVVAFIDVLGQREEFKILDGVVLNDDEETKKKLAELHNKTTEYIDTLRSGFKDYFDSIMENNPVTDKVPHDKIPLFKEMNQSNLNYKYFSDSIQIYVPLIQNKYCSHAVNGVYGVLTACGSMMLLSLALGKAFRAGIDIGVGTQIEKDEVYGPGLFKAYDLENKIAQYPRIIVGDNLINYLNGHVQGYRNEGQEDIDVEWCKRIATLCLNLVGTDVDGYRILHYLGDDFLNYLKMKESEAKLIIDKAYVFVTNEYKKFIEKRNSKLSTRYFLLKRYFDHYYAKKQVKEKQK